MSKYKVTTDQGSYIVTVDDAPPGPAKAPLPLGLQPEAQWRQSLGLPEEPQSMPSMLGHMAMSPLTGLMSIPGQIKQYLQHGNQPSGGFLGDDPFSEAAGNMLGAVGAEMAPSMRSPVTVGPGRFVEPTSSMLRSAAEHFMPAPLRMLSRAVRSGGDEPVPAGTLRRLQLRSPFAPEDTRSPVWDGTEAGTPAQLPDVNPITPTSTRRVPPPKVTPRDPLWQGLVPDATPTGLPDVQPIQSSLPSGRVPGPAAPKTPKSPGQPLWKGLVPEPTARTLPDVQPIIPEALPSGRIPGKPTQGQLSVPYEPFPKQEDPFMGHEDLMPIDRVELNRMLHAKVQRLELPNSPAGQKAPGLLTKAAQDVFNQSYDKLTIPQLKELYSHLDTLSK